MPNILYKKMNNSTLLASAKGAVKREKELTAVVLEHLQEIERRKAYCELGIQSLFRYCVEILGHYEAESSYRVNATRLVSISPRAKKGIEDGELTLTAASKLHGHIKNERKTWKNQKVTVEKLDQLVEKAKGKSTRQLEVMLDQLSTSPKRLPKKVELNERMEKMLEKLRDHYGEHSDQELLEIVLNEKLSKLQQEKCRRKTRGSNQQRYIDRAAKEAVITRSGNRCEYVSKEGKRCQARLHLQIDHIHPLALGGKSEAGNLRHLCFSHNQHAAIKQLGLKQMEKYHCGDHVD